MKGYVVVTKDAGTFYFPNAGHWKQKNSYLNLKDEQCGTKIVSFNWSNVVCIHKSDDVERNGGHSN